MGKRIFGITIDWLFKMIKEFGLRDGIRVYWCYTRTNWMLHRTKVRLIRLRNNIVSKVHSKIFSFRMKRAMKKSVKVFDEMANVLVEIGDAASDCTLAMKRLHNVYVGLED